MSVTGLPFLDAPCPAGSYGVKEVGGFCILDYSSSDSWWGAGAHFSSGGETISNYVFFDASYVPNTGDWKLTAYICNRLVRDSPSSSGVVVDCIIS